MKVLRKTLVSVLFFMCICIGTSAKAKEKPTSGTDVYGNTWTYDTTTKTMAFLGNGKVGADYIPAGHGYSPEWHCWNKEVEHLIIGDGITAIGRSSFCDFWKLQSVKLPQSLELIEDRAFSTCMELRGLEFPDSMVEIGDYAFWGCEKLQKITLPSTLTKIGKSAFEDTGIKELIIPNSVKSIGNDAFLGCTKLEKITLPSGLKKIGDGTFYNCKRLTKIDIPESVTQIGVSAFAFSGIKKLIIPKNVEKFYRTKGELASKNYDGLFVKCKSLRTVTIQSKKLKTLCKYSLSKTSKKTTIRVPKSKLKTYKKMFRKAGLSKKVKVRSI